jgi:pimeloyl-ACP methyl ester carboxylesterase
MANVRKGFVDVPHGEVHFRYGGSGPTVVLLHDSPRSSVPHIPNIEWLGEHFTVIALDTPGHGLSSPLTAAEPGIADYARALAETLSALGIERCALYGFHTSSKIALQFAVDHPQRAVLTILDGLSLPEQPPTEAFLANSLKHFEPTADGAYIASQWTKILDFHRYFPWFSLTAESRVALGLPDDRGLQEYATDAFMAGAAWTGAYGAALRYQAAPVIRQLSSPTAFLCREDDVLFGHLDELPSPLPDQSRIVRIPAVPGAWRQHLMELLREARGHDARWSLPVPAVPEKARARHQRYVNLLHGQVRVGLHGQASGKVPVLLLHDLPGSPRQLDGLAASLAVDRLTLAPDLPGLGESDPLPSATLGAYVSVIDETLEELGLESVDIVAEGLGTVFAAALAANRPRRVRRIIVDGVPMIRTRDRKRYVREYCPRILPDRAGSYLQRLWEQLRSAQVSWPWFERSATAARVRDVELDAHVMHAALVDSMKQLDNYGDAARAALDASMRDIVRGIAQPVLVMQDSRDVRYTGSGSLRRRLQNATVRPRPASLAERAVAYRGFLD